MKGTEVPNLRRSSACGCTCVLTRNYRSVSRDSLMLAMRIVLFLPMQSSLKSFWHSITGLVQLIFSFPSWFHTPLLSYVSCFLSQITLCHDHSVHMSSVLQVQQLYTAGIALLEAYLLPLSNNQQSKIATSHVVQIHMHARFPWSKKWPTYHVAVPTGNL